jgi:hypothetical protein
LFDCCYQRRGKRGNRKFARDASADNREAAFNLFQLLI